MFLWKTVMRIRIDSVFISSLLFTIALLNLIPAGRWYFSAGTDEVSMAELDVGFQLASQTAHLLGIACLTIILIGLIVVWTGYIKRSRSAWLVMSVVTWAWAFPLFAWPNLRGPKVFTLPEWIFNAIYQRGYPRSKAQLVVTFSLNGDRSTLADEIILSCQRHVSTDSSTIAKAHRPLRCHRSTDCDCAVCLDTRSSL